jgi:hypothetical protein
LPGQQAHGDGSDDGDAQAQRLHVDAPEFVEDQVVLVLGDRDLEQSHTAGTPPAWENLVQDSQNTILTIRVARRTRDRSGET